ncbi:MAG: hypothetical protein ACE5FF_00145 [Saprospiraceae bacterium]
MPSGLTVMRYLVTCILLLLFFGTALAQSESIGLMQRSFASSPGLQMKADNFPRFHIEPFTLPLLNGFASSETPSLKTRPLPVVYSVNDLPLFCKWEVKLEKAATFPVKFRLGEVQYVEHLEGKY